MEAVAAKRREERFKLLATFASNIGVAALVTGVLAPGFSGVAQPAGIVTGLLFAAVCHTAGQAVLHWVVRTPLVEESA